MIGRGLKHLLVAIVLLELVYVVVGNIALNSQWVQDELNRFRPERFQATWRSGWTVWPFQLHVEQLAADGQTHSKQWQIDALKVVGRLQVWPLLQRRVRLTHVTADSVDFRLRALPNASHDYSAIESGFPVIRRRDPTLRATPRKVKTGKGWQLQLINAQVRGHHELWLNQVNAHLSGDAHADINYTTRGGPIEIGNGGAQVTVDSLKVGVDGYVAHSGSIAGSFSLVPYLRSQYPGLEGLRFLTAEADIDMDVAAIDFVNVYLRRFKGISIAGAGLVQGQAHWQHGDLVAPTKLSINASSLQLNTPDYRINGDGRVVVEAAELATDETATEVLQFSTTFSDFVARRRLHDDEQIMLKGDALSITLKTDNHVLLWPENQSTTQRVSLLENQTGKQADQKHLARAQKRNRVSKNALLAPRQTRFYSLLVKVPQVTVPDIKTYQAYLPKKWPLTLNGGAGLFQGQLLLTPTVLDSKLELSSTSAAISLKQVDLTTGLKLTVNARGSAEDKAQLNLSGTQLSLDNAVLRRGQLDTPSKASDKPWHATLALNEGLVTIGAPKLGEAPIDDVLDFKTLILHINEQGPRLLLSTMNSNLKGKFIVSDIGWINQLFRNNLKFSLAGSGEAQANIAVHHGWLNKGSTVTINPKNLHVNVLDYVARGDGEISVTVDKGGSNPSIKLNTSILQGQVQKIGDGSTVIDQADINLTALASNLGAGNNAELASISIQIPKAKVLDVTAYNAYMPPTVPVQLLAGNAHMSADVRLFPNDANGVISIRAEEVKTAVAEQILTGKLDMKVNIADGNPMSRSFAIDDSFFELYDFGVEGELRDFRTPGWRATIKVNEGEVEWKKPIALNLQADIDLANSRPFVAIMANQLKKHRWLEKLATVEDIKGEITAQIDAGQLRIPYAYASSEIAEIGAKGIFAKKSNQGVLFAKYRKVRGILKFNDQHRNFDIIGAPRKFRSYSPPMIPALVK